MCCFTCHVSLCLLEPTSNLQIIEAQLTNPFMGKTTANLHDLLKLSVQTLKPGHGRTLGRTLYNHNVFWKQDSQVLFACRPCNNIHQFEGCFLRDQVRSNGFKHFNACIVGYLNFTGLSAKTLENLLFWENVVIGQSSSKCLGLILRTAMYYFSLDGLFTYSNVAKMIQCLPTTSSCYSD